MISFFVFIIGSIFGSFFNVLIYRLPLEQDVVLKPSACPNCKKPISWKNNIPILSYLILRGKCSDCHEKINISYPIVEFVIALNFLINYLIFGISLSFLFSTLFTSALILIFMTDFKHFLIFDIVTLPFAIIGVIVSLLSINPYEINFINSVIGGLTGYVIIFFIRWIYFKLRKVEGMGLGDAKLFLMLGTWLGIHSLLFILLISSVLGSIIGIAIIIFGKKSRDTHIPYGCFIVIAAFAYIFVGEWFYNSLF